jgi:hypothetical protein
MNGLRKCGIYTHWNFIQLQRKNKILSFTRNGWNWGTSYSAKLDSEGQKSHVLLHMQITDSKQLQ